MVPKPHRKAIEMTSTNTLFVAPTANDVREWATKRGIEVKPGRLPFALVERFNRGRKVPYVATMKQPEKLIVTTGKRADAKGVNRSVKVTVTPTALRAWAKENGLPMADHGRLPKAVVAAYANREARV